MQKTRCPLDGSFQWRRRDEVPSIVSSDGETWKEAFLSENSLLHSQASLPRSLVPVMEIYKFMIMKPLYHVGIFLMPTMHLGKTWSDIELFYLWNPQHSVI